MSIGNQISINLSFLERSSDISSWVLDIPLLTVRLGTYQKVFTNREMTHRNPINVFDRLRTNRVEMLP